MKNIYDRLIEGETYVAAFGFSGSCLLIFVSAIMRGLGYPINWAWDMTLFLFAWSVFLAADSAMRHNKLVNVELVVDFFPAKWKTWCSVANYAIILIFLIALVFIGIKLSYTTRSRTFQGMPGFSYTWVTLAIPVGAALMIVTTVRKIKTFWAQLAR